MRLKKIMMSLIALSLYNPSYAKELALSFDDGLNPTTNPKAQQINDDLLQHLSEHKIKSIIFPSYIKIGDTKGKNLVKQWGEQGHLIGNHSAFHQNLNKDDVTATEYIQSIKINETIFSDLPNFVYLYRFPFLKEGNTVEKRDSVQTWLISNKYKHGSVSIDASDWFYNIKYLEYIKSKNNEKLELLKQAYISHLLDRAQYYDNLALQTIGRSPKHVLLLHTNAINAAFLQDIIAAFESHEWNFVDAEEAFKDPLYTQYSQNIPAGESIIWSIAKSNNFSNLRYPAEDAPYETENLKEHRLLD